VGFAAAGIAGAGASPITYARVLVHRFNEHRGLALGIALSGTGLGGIILPMLMRPVVVAQGWRAALELLAAIAAVVGVLAGLAMGRESPASERHGDAGMSLRQAASTATFWKMAGGFAVLGIVLAGVVSHLTEIWLAFHWDTARVPAFQAIVGTATILGRLAGGALMDQVAAKLVGAAAALCGAGGLALLGGGAGTGLSLFVIGAAIGVCTGTESDVVSYLASRYFGLLSFARIYAVLGAFFMMGFALGPIAAARAFERMGIDVTLLSGAALLVGSSLILLSLPPYSSRPQHE
jgi:MFS family permease